MALQIVGELRTVALDLRMHTRDGVLRNAVKRRFLWRLGRERSCSEEGIGSPRQVTTLVFIGKEKNLYIHPSGYRSGNGFGWAELRASAEAFASGANLDLVKHQMSFPIRCSPIDPWSITSLGDGWRTARQA